MWSAKVARGAALTACLVLVGCSSSTPSGPAASAPAGSSGATGPGVPYNVGLLGAFSGQLAFVGGPYRDGADAYIQYVNSQGGVNGHQIVATGSDTQGTAALATAAVTKLVQQNDVIGMIDAGGTAATGALAPLLNQYSVSDVGQSCVPEQVFDPMQTKFCFLSGVVNTAMAKAQMTYALKALKPGGTIALIPTNNPYGLAWAPAAESTAKDLGGSIVATEFVPLTGVDMSAAVQAVVKSKPDVVLTVLSDPQMVSFGQGLAQAGVDVPILNYSGGNATKTFQTLANPNFYAIRYFPYPQDTATPGMQQFDAATKAAKIDPTVPFTIEGYLAAKVLLAGIQACGDDCTREKLASIMDTLTVPMDGLAQDPFQFSSTNHMGLGTVGVYQMKNAADPYPQLAGTAPTK